MKTLILCVGFYGLGVFNCAVFAAVYLLHRPRYVAPTKRRKNRDNRERGQLMSEDEAAYAKKLDGGHQPISEVGGIRYEHLGMTGHEE
jgi:hypothetical protein